MMSGTHCWERPASTTIADNVYYDGSYCTLDFHDDHWVGDWWQSCSSHTFQINFGEERLILIRHILTWRHSIFYFKIMQKVFLNYQVGIGCVPCRKLLEVLSPLQLLAEAGIRHQFTGLLKLAVNMSMQLTIQINIDQMLNISSDNRFITRPAPLVEGHNTNNLLLCILATVLNKEIS